MTEWDIFRALDLKKIARVMTAPILVDLRNIYPKAEANAAGFRLFRVGGPDAATEGNA